ncbi:MAG: ATP-binding cassette domain-containing protein, partial [Myxococcota bacterium]
MASADRLLNLLELERESEEAGTPAEPGLFKQDIQFQSVSFAYSDGQSALEDVNVVIPGEGFVGLVGSTGSGKSTLIKLLLRFYEPNTGSIRIGDRDIASLPIEELRRHIAWVGQDAFLFHGTIHDNIALGAGSVGRDAVVAAAKAAELHEFVESLPRGYDTVLGDFGATLSGGQRQRLSIARAILKDPAILILDEATSAVDNETEAAIQRSMLRVAQGRTVLAVAHRLSTVRHADAIIVLEHGRIAESGDHQYLLASRADLHRPKPRVSLATIEEGLVVTGFGDPSVLHDDER